MPNSPSFNLYKDLALWLRDYLQPWVLAAELPPIPAHLEEPVTPYAPKTLLVKAARDFDSAIAALANAEKTTETHAQEYLQAYMALISEIGYDAAVTFDRITDPVLIRSTALSPPRVPAIFQYDALLVANMREGDDYIRLPLLKEKLNTFYASIHQAIKTTEGLTPSEEAERAAIEAWVKHYAAEPTDIQPVRQSFLEHKAFLFWFTTGASLVCGGVAVGGIYAAANGPGIPQEAHHGQPFCGDDGTGYRCYPTPVPEHPTLAGMNPGLAGPLFGAAAGTATFLLALLLTRPRVRQGIQQLANAPSVTATFLRQYFTGNRQPAQPLDPEMGVPLVGGNARPEGQ